jgi:uncharacterized Rossmann fold enzyme
MTTHHVTYNSPKGKVVISCSGFDAADRAAALARKQGAQDVRILRIRPAGSAAA